MAFELFNQDGHLCLMFSDLVDDHEDQTIQSNQFLIVSDGHGALIDPGGNMTYNALRVAMHGHFTPAKLDYVLASHADPDIITSVNKWLVHSECKVYISALWSRFVPHLCGIGSTTGRIVGIPDAGMEIRLGRRRLIALPAHFLHAEGNFHFYDPEAKILFSGDMAASIVLHEQAVLPVADISKHIPLMKSFHQRLMVSNKVLRYWVAMVRKLDLEWLVPQHGRPIYGAKAIADFLDWAESLPCGIDLMSQDNYQDPVPLKEGLPA